MKKLNVWLICLGFVLFLLAGGLQAQKPTIVMKDAEGKVSNPIYKPVAFPHQKHFALGCKTCHHKWTDTSKPPAKCTSQGCHDLIGAQGEDMVKPNSAYSAYHKSNELRSCVGCHAKKKAEGLKTGPVACVQCHKPVSK